VSSGKDTDLSKKGQLQKAPAVYNTIWRNIAESLNLHTIPNSTADFVKGRDAFTFTTFTLFKEKRTPCLYSVVRQSAFHKLTFKHFCEKRGGTATQHS
jgi:hypothetical protein